MTEQKNSAPQRLSDEDLEAATGGAGGFNPLYGLSGDPYSPFASALVATGNNPLYVAPAEPYVPLIVPQAQVPAPVPAPQPTPAPEPTVIPMTSDPFGGGSLNIGSPISTQQVITASITISDPLIIDIPKETQPEVTVMTFAEQPYTVITPTTRGVRPAGESNNNDRIQAGGSLSPLESAFDLGLVRK